MTFFVIAWRNIYKSPQRTLLLLTGICVGVICLNLFLSLMDGFMVLMVDTVVQGNMGHIQVHNDDYLKKQEVSLTLHQPEKMVEVIEKVPHVVGVSPRIIINGLVSSAENSSFGRVYSIDPQREGRVTIINKKLIRGETLRKKDAQGIYMGESLAKKLKVDVGDKVVVSTSNLNGEMTGGAYRIRGIYRTGSDNFDKVCLYINIESAEELLEIKDQVHEIAIKVDSQERVDAVAHNIKQAIKTAFPHSASITPSPPPPSASSPVQEDESPATTHFHTPATDSPSPVIASVSVSPIPSTGSPAFEPGVQTWKELNPLITVQMEMANITNLIIFFIVFIAMIFGILNSFLMEIFERIKEFGIMMALGTHPRDIFLTIVYEGFIMGIIGGGVGSLLFVFLVYVLLHGYMDFSVIGGGFEYIGISNRVPLIINNQHIMNTFLGTLVTTLLAGIIPAWRASRFHPVEAMRYE